jgi:hypothetical protein
MNINCMNDKIANSHNTLKPIILRAILNVYENGNNEISAQMVKNECDVIANTIIWNNRIPAICNAMRKSLECGGRIIGENRDFNGFTIKFGEKIEVSGGDSQTKSKPSESKVKAETSKKDNFSADQKINSLINSLDWKNIKDKNRKKLLIIGCSHSKNVGGEINIEQDYFAQQTELIINRNLRFNEYTNLLQNEQQYFRERIGYLVEQNNNHLFMSAIQRYNGRFYSDVLRQLYLEKNQNSNLHILIISGLYGLIEFRDSIIDYHLEISKRPLWTMQNNTIIHNSIRNYIFENQIEDEMVFYSLSQGGNHSYVKALKPLEEWKNLWITHGRGAKAVRFLRDHFLPEL